MAPTTRSFTIEQLKEWDIPHGRANVIARETEDVGRRWMDVVTCVFKAPDDGLTYSFCYDVGKTEHQECSWDEELDNPVVATRVTLRQVKIDQWVPVDQEDEAAA